MKRNAEARNAASVVWKVQSCADEPTATTSNGDPPPELAFDSWLFTRCVADAAALLLLGDGGGGGGCATLVGGALVIDVALGSVAMAPVDDAAVSVVLELSVVVSRAEVDVEVVDAVVRTCELVLVEVAVFELMVVTWTPGQSACMPMPF